MGLKTTNSQAKSGTIRLTVGITSVLLGIFILLYFVSRDLIARDIVISVLFVLGFVFFGGYEIGKYAENRHLKLKSG
jgi:hypothetical protein